MGIQWRERIAKLNRGLPVPATPRAETQLQAVASAAHKKAAATPSRAPLALPTPEAQDTEPENVAEDRAWRVAVTANREALETQREARRREEAWKEREAFWQQWVGTERLKQTGAVG